MVQTLGLNSANDLYLGDDGNIVMLSGIEAVAGGCYTISKTQLGEMIYAITQGIPNFQAAWLGVPNLKVWQSYLRKMIQNVPGVVKIQNIQILQQNNTLVYTATIETQFGTTTISG